MKKGLIMLALAFAALAANAQSIIDAENGRNYNDFYHQDSVAGKQPMPYPFLRGSDVVWKWTIWRVIDMNENFNQFMYYPIETETGTQGRVSLVHLIVEAAIHGEIEVYDGDDLTVAFDSAGAYGAITGPPITRTVDSTDQNGEKVYDDEYEPIKVTKTEKAEFDLAAVKRVMLKETWYIDKQDTRQKVRITGLTFEVTTTSTIGEVKDWAFWVPMDDLRVRKVLVNANAFDENNIVAEKSYDDVFIQRYFDSYVVQESNKYNRKIEDYLTGTDALYESRSIEEKIFNIESDMWEY